MSIIKDLFTGKEKPSLNAKPLSEIGKIQEATNVYQDARQILNALVDIQAEYDRINQLVKRETEEDEIRKLYGKLNELSEIRKKAKDNYLRYFQYSVKLLG